MSRVFDAIIVGAGQAGPALAGRLTGAGMKVALIERHLFGGTCVNTGCMPTKALVASAYAAHIARRGGEFGVMLAAPPVVDMGVVAARAGKVASTARGNVESWLRGMEGLTVITGHARFQARDTLRVGEELLSAPRIFLNVGGRAAIPEMPGLAEVPYLTNGTIIGLDRLPEHLVVIGGSYIGLEFAQIYRRFGAAVTVVEKGPRLVAREDEEVSEAIREILEDEGIAIRTGTDCIGFARKGERIAVSVDCASGSPAIEGSDVLLAVGRRPNTDDLGLERAGIATDRRGHIQVDDALATNVPGVWALGECNGRGAFTHTAYNDYEIVAANLLDGEERRLGARIPGYALFIDPPLGRVGMTLAEARASGRPLLIGKRPMSRVGRAIEKGETKGFMSVVADAQTRRVLGAAILGTGGDEAIHGLLDLMTLDQPFDRLVRSVPIHPTVSELLPTLLNEMKPG
jgi:pyruvate/2-oxoglutarate dehydrogenase complex dihydrolipoamide dehydrogenase (E3) component